MGDSIIYLTLGRCVAVSAQKLLQPFFMGREMTLKQHLNRNLFRIKCIFHSFLPHYLIQLYVVRFMSNSFLNDNSRRKSLFFPRFFFAVIITRVYVPCYKVQQLLRSSGINVCAVFGRTNKSNAIITDSSAHCECHRRDTINER